MDLRHVSKARSQHRAADAIADRIDLLGAARFFHRVERGKHAGLQIIVEVEPGEALVGIDPGDDEHREALIDRPADEGFLRVEIEDVELVDPGRENEQRALVNRLGGGRVLQKLEELVAVNDLAGGEREISPDLESRKVGLADRELALAALKVLEHVCKAAHQVLAIFGKRRAQHLGVGEDEIGRCDRVSELLGIEVELRPGLFVEPFDVRDGALQPARGQKIALLDEIEDLVVLPLRIAEAFVAGQGGDDRLDLLAQHAARGLVPQGGVVAPQIELRLHHPLGVRQDARQQLGHRARQVEGVKLGRFRIFGLTGQELAQELLRLARNMDHIGRKGRRIGRFGEEPRLFGRLRFTAGFSVFVVHF